MAHDTESEELGKEKRPAAHIAPFTLFVLFEAGLAPLAVVLGWAFGQNPLGDFVWEEGAFYSGILAALPMLVLLACAVRWPIGPLVRIKTFFDRELAPLLEGCEWPDLALLSIAAGVGEEMLFRGVIQGVMMRVLGPILGLAGASVLFGLLHPVSVAYVIMAALLGAYLGYVWIASGNLLTVIVAHAVYDFIALIVMLDMQATKPDED